MTKADTIRTSLRRRTVLATAIAAIALAGAADAHANPDPVDLKVVDRETGQPLRIWRHHGRLFVAGRPGARYGLRVTNHTDRRVLVVLSVDGVNIISGETASYDQRGYIFKAYESYDLNGWRKSTSEIAAFTFAPLPQSYAARTGRPTDVGVIGMAVFNERVDVEAEALAPPEDDSDQSSSGADIARRAPGVAPRGRAGLASPPAPPPPATKSAPATAPSEVVTAERRDEKLGTAHGPREWSVSNVEPFERATPYPQWVRQIEYDSYHNLVASGVIPRQWGARPRPFPSEPDGAGYVPDPPS
jgi:hypothetical protein